MSKEKSLLTDKTLHFFIDYHLWRMEEIKSKKDKNYQNTLYLIDKEFEELKKGLKDYCDKKPEFKREYWYVLNYINEKQIEFENSKEANIYSKYEEKE